MRCRTHEVYRVGCCFNCFFLGAAAQAGGGGGGGGGAGAARPEAGRGGDDYEREMAPEHLA